MINILQIGPISYVGGVSIHIKRLTSLLSKEKEFSFIDESPKHLSPHSILNVRRISHQFKIIKALNNADIIHIHSGNWLLRLYFLFFSTLLGKTIIVTLHSYRLTGFRLRITNYFLKKTQRIIAVSVEIQSKLPSLIKDKSEVLEAFIPPLLDEEPVLPKELKKVLVTYKESILLCANAFRIIKYNGAELYGLDQCIKIAERFKVKKENIHIIFVIGTIKNEDEDYLNKFLKKIEDKNLGNYITIFPKSLSFVRLISKCDVVLRPTQSDGDALTIREAIFLNKPVIASDVVKRPKGTTVYKTNDTDDLYNKIKELSSSKNILDLSKFENSFKNYKKKYLKIYNQCNNSHKN